LVPLLEKLFPNDEFPRLNIEVSPAEAEERTLRLIKSILSCVAFDDRPLVLFVDDLQWCSVSEASVLGGLITSFRATASTNPVRNCLLIITYRVSELTESTFQKLTDSIEKIKRRGSFSEIRGAVELHVGPLRLVSLITDLS
jgi:predicted ATPase